ncbi:hypothetical protein PSAC2689_100051 [Paraburkholderia sacchari]
MYRLRRSPFFPSPLSSLRRGRTHRGAYAEDRVPRAEASLSVMPGQTESQVKSDATNRQSILLTTDACRRQKRRAARGPIKEREQFASPGRPASGLAGKFHFLYFLDKLDDISIFGIGLIVPLEKAHVYGNHSGVRVFAAACACCEGAGSYRRAHPGSDPQGCGDFNAGRYRPASR